MDESDLRSAEFQLPCTPRPELGNREIIPGQRSGKSTEVSHVLHFSKIQPQCCGSIAGVGLYILTI